MYYLLYISELLIPLISAYIIIRGLLARCNIFEDFIHGATEGIKTVFKLLPTLIGLLVAVTICRDSGLLDFLCNLLQRGFLALHITFFPSEVIPLSLIKMVSGSAANGLLVDIFKEYGTDTFIGMTASIMMSCTETMLYCFSVYFGSFHIVKSRWALPGCLAASAAGIFASAMIASFLC